MEARGAGGGSAVPRRTALTWALRGAAGVLAVASGAACASPKAAQPPPAPTPVVLTLLPTAAFTNFPLQLQQRIFDEFSDDFRRQHGGLQVRLLEPGFQGAAQASLLAGNGPDVVSDWIMTGYTALDLLLDLRPLVQQDNVRLDAFLPGQLDFFRASAEVSPTNPNGLYGLPAYINTVVYVVNQGVLDQLGQSYPEPDWDWRQWTRLWEAATQPPGKAGPARSGGWIDWRGYDHTYNMPSPWVLAGWGGEYVDAADPGRCALRSAESIACGEWVYGLVWSGVCNGSSDFAGGRVVCFVHQSGDMVTAARSFGGLKWDFYAPPLWPARKTTYVSTDFSGIWAGTRQPELAWRLLHWLTVGPDWQRVLMKVALISPNQPALWEEWKANVLAVAPPLASKNVQVFLDQVRGGTAYAGRLFRSASNSDKAALGVLAGQLRARQTSVAEGFRTVSDQIDAIEATAAATLPALRQRQQKVQRDFPTQGRDVATVPTGI
jgi:ABC-type glycerol-3-phosphate transport system substrate-binding protein